jgi:hypothetical protein
MNFLFSWNLVALVIWNVFYFDVKDCLEVESVMVAWLLDGLLLFLFHDCRYAKLVESPHG